MKYPLKTTTGAVLAFATFFVLIQSATANLIYNPGFELAGSIASQGGSSNTTLTIPGWVLFGAGETTVERPPVRPNRGFSGVAIT